MLRIGFKWLFYMIGTNQCFVTACSTYVTTAAEFVDERRWEIQRCDWKGCVLCHRYVKLRYVPIYILSNPSFPSFFFFTYFSFFYLFFSCFPILHTCIPHLRHLNCLAFECASSFIIMRYASGSEIYSENCN